MKKHWWMVAAALALGCSTAPNDGPHAPIGGTWTYHATQTTTPVSSIVGTMVIDTTPDGQFTGTISVTVTLPDNSTVALSGTLSGQSTNATDVLFDVFFTQLSDSRVHGGRIFNSDSLTGSWAQGNGAPGTPQGTFWAKRVTS